MHNIGFHLYVLINYETLYIVVYCLSVVYMSMSYVYISSKAYVEKK